MTSIATSKRRQSFLENTFQCIKTIARVSRTSRFPGRSWIFKDGRDRATKRIERASLRALNVRQTAVHDVSWLTEFYMLFGGNCCKSPRSCKTAIVKYRRHDKIFQEITTLSLIHHIKFKKITLHHLSRSTVRVFNVLLFFSAILYYWNI